MREAYKQVKPLQLVPLAVNASDHQLFINLCSKHSCSAAEMFHRLLLHYG